MTPRSLLLALKVIASVHVSLLTLQPVLAGQYFGGRLEAMAAHGTLGETVAWLAILQAIVALLSWRCKALSLWGACAFLTIFVLDGLQVHAGHAKLLALHVPLGTALLAVSFALTLWLWRQSPARAVSTA